MSTLITSANSIKALIITRDLGKKDIRIYTADEYKTSLSSYSKYSSAYFKYCSPKISERIFIKDIINIINKNKIEVLMPVHSKDTYIISKYKKILSKYTNVPYADYNKIIEVNDKGKLMKLASKLNLKIPATYYYNEYKDINNMSKILQYPVVIKLRNTSMSEGLSYAYNKNDFKYKYRYTLKKYRIKEVNQYPIVQEYIFGDAYGVSLIYNKGKLLGKFTHKRIREYPITGGPSTYRISVKNSEMEEIAIKLIGSLDWHGVVMVEFKYDKINNEPKIIEVNPRFVGSINQAISSGIDFPYILYQIAKDEEVKPCYNYKLGIKTRNLFIDTISFLQNFQKYHRIKDYNPFNYKIKDDVISFDDPKPIVKFLQIGYSEIG